MTSISTANIARKILAEQAASRAAAAREAETEAHRLAVQKDRVARVEARAARLNGEFASITATLTKAGKISLVNGWVATAMSNQLTATSSAQEFRSAYNALRFAREWAKHPSRLKPARVGNSVTVMVAAELPIEAVAEPFVILPDDTDPPTEDEPASSLYDSTAPTTQVEPVCVDNTPEEVTVVKTAVPAVCLTIHVLNGRMEVLASRLTDDVKQQLDADTLTLVTVPLAESLTTLEAIRVHYAQPGVLLRPEG